MPPAPRPAAVPSIETKTWDTDATATADDGNAVRSKWRRRLITLVALMIAAAAIAYGSHWFLTGRFLETTDDAYLQADSAVVAPKIAGYIASVSVTDNQAVTAGQVVARIDDRDYQVELAEGEADVDQAKAELTNIAAQVEQQNARLAQSEAALASANAQADFARQEAGRFSNLVAGGAVSVRQAEQASSELKQARAAVTESEAARDTAKKQITVLESAQVKAEAALKRAEASLEQARLRVSYTQITAPLAGVVGDRSVRVGQYVQPGSRLLTIVPLQDVYLVANFKETQLRDVYRGERVRIALDIYPDADVTGTVDSLAPGTGAEFALLPAENATGNFTKIVQRVPVKILIDRASLGGIELRPGLSATATVDTRTAPPNARTTEAAMAGERP
jgi:membrane fusion protein (multidrug efflux system)